MTNDKPRSLISSQLTHEQALVTLHGLVNCFKAQGQTNVVVSLGWGWNLPLNQLWIDKLVAVDAIEEFVKQLDTDGFGKLGSGDLFITILNPETRIELTHESFLRISTVDLDIEKCMSSALLEENVKLEPYP